MNIDSPDFSVDPIYEENLDLSESNVRFSQSSINAHNINISHNINIFIDPINLAKMFELKEHVNRLANASYKALPPWAERARIEKAIRDDEKIREALGGDVISIEKDENTNVYIVHGQDKDIEVDVKYGHSDLIGPLPFTLEIRNN